MVISSGNIDKVSQQFSEYCEKYSRSTQECYRRYINRFLRKLPKSAQRIDKIKSSHISQYLEEMYKEGVPESTLNLHLRVIKSFFRWAAWAYDIPERSREVRSFDETIRPMRVLTAQQYLKVIQCNKGLIRDTILFLGNTGLKSSEFLNLRWKNIDERLISVKVITIKVKGVKERSVPINSTVRQVLTRYPRGRTSKLPFAVSNRRALLRLCQRAAKRADVETFSPQSLRDYFAVRLILSDVPIENVSYLLGHSCVAVTENVYSQWIKKGSSFHDVEAISDIDVFRSLVIGFEQS